MNFLLGSSARRGITCVAHATQGKNVAKHWGVNEKYQTCTHCVENVVNVIVEVPVHIRRVCEKGVCAVLCCVVLWCGVVWCGGGMGEY